MGYSRYDFIREIVSDGVEYIRTGFKTRNVDKDDVYDLLFVSPVTGNDSGSYSFNAYVSAERISWEALEILIEDCNEFGGNLANYIEEGPEYCEVIIRCHLLGECIDEILEELEDAGFFGDSDDEDEEE